MLFCFTTFPHVFFVSYHLAHYFAPSHLVCLIALPAMSGPMDATTTAPETTVPAQQIGTTTPDRVSTPPNQPSTTDSSSMVSVAPPPPEAYNALNYHFNHQLPTTAPFYRPDDTLNHLTAVEYDSIHTPTVDQGQNYAEVYAGLTLEEYQLLSQQQTTPMPDLPTANPQPAIRPTNAPLRFTTTQPTLFRSALTSLHLTTSHTNIVRLHLPQEILLHYISSGHLINFSRDYLSHMVSVIGQHDLPTRQLPQRLRHEPAHHHLQPVQQLHLELPHASSPS